jgi:molecular chaperone GrpE (heat shock protein)
MADKPCDTDADLVKAELLGEIKVLQEKVAGLKEAIVLQAAEYSRRLKELNNAHERAQTDREDFLTKSQYESKHDALVNQITELEKWRSFVLGLSSLSGILGIAALILAILDRM